jgi:hypothetical protein
MAEQSFGAGLGDYRGGGFGLNYNQGFAGMKQPTGGLMQSTGSFSQDLGKAGFQGYQDRLGIAAQGDVQKDLEGMRQGGENSRAQIAADASTLPARFQQDRFNTLFPWIQGQLGNLGGQGHAGYAGGGQVGTQPQINTNPIYSDSQVQQMVNTGRAANDQKTAGQVQKMQGDLAGRGFGSNSPLAQSLSMGYQGMNTAANAGQETQTRLGAAKDNAGHVLDAQKAAEGQFANRQQEDIQRNTIRQNYMNSYLGLLGSLAG